MRKRKSNPRIHVAPPSTSHREGLHIISEYLISRILIMGSWSRIYHDINSPRPYPGYRFAFLALLTPGMFALLYPLLKDVGLVDAVDRLFSIGEMETFDAAHEATKLIFVLAFAASLGIEKYLAPSIGLLHNAAKALLALSWFLWRGILAVSVGTLLVAIVHALQGG